MSRLRKSAGFTLVELLVVIGIISLLISILLPSLNKARQAAQTVQCASNMRTLGQLVAIYQSNNRGYLPPMSQWAANGAFSSNNFRGYNLWGLLGIGAYNRVAVCPTLLANLPSPTWAASNNNLRSLYSYRYNWLLSGCETNKTVYPDVPHATSLPSQASVNGIVGKPYNAVPHSADTLLFIDMAQIVAFQTNDLSGTDRGMSWAAAQPLGGAPMTSPVLGDGIPHQVIRSLHPIHGTIRSVPNGLTLSDGSVPLQGYINVCYCDGSVRAAYIRQGLFNATADPSAKNTLLNDSTSNGSFQTGNAGIVPDTRLDPNLAP